jgi:hypothetical protein
MMMNEEADPDDLQAVFAHEYEDVYDFQVRRRQHPFTYLFAGLRIRIRIGSGFNQASGSGSGFRIRIRIQEGKNDPKSRKIFVKAHKCWMASFES